MACVLLAGSSLVSADRAIAGKADVLAAQARCSPDSRCAFRVQVRHADEGWEHYADRWEVLSPEGELLATRMLRHPHVDEQPFTRVLGPVAIPPELDRVRIRAGDSVHGLGGAEITIPLERPRQPKRAAGTEEEKGEGNP